MSTKKIDVSRFELLMDAGFGAQKSGDILIRAFAHTGRYIFIEPMIPSEISPPKRSRYSLSGALIRVANFDLKNSGNSTDIILAQHEVVLDRRLDDEEHSTNCKILLDMGNQENHPETYEKIIKRCEDLGLKIYPFSICEEGQAQINNLGGKGVNMFYLGMLSKVYNLPEEIVTKEIRDIFKKKLTDDLLAGNIEIFHLGYKYAVENVELSKTIEASPELEGERFLIDGNSALAMGLIDAGIKFFSGYPITPASSIMHILAKTFPSFGGIVHQAEDEISAIGAAIGAYYGGVPTATATSGPGLSLKQEFIGFAASAEIPLILIDVQRCGPSTGMPTKTEQADLPCAIWGSHGDNTKIIIGVGGIMDCFYAPKMARYLTEKLKLPVFIMSDFQMANSYKVIPMPKMSKMENPEDIDDFLLDYYSMNRLPDDIEMNRDNQAIPGTPGKAHKTMGLNSDKDGTVTYFAKVNQRSHEIRNEKVHHVQRALKMPDLFGNVHEGEILVIGWGTTRGAIAEAVHSCQDQGLSVGGFCFRITYPLPLSLKDVLSKFKHVVTVEAAYGDAMKKPPLAMLLRSKTLIDVQCIVCRATGRPISPRSIENKIKDVLDGKHV